MTEAIALDPAPVEPSPTKIDLPETHAEGIHFNLPEDAYHADPSLGSGSIRQLAKCPIYYWRDSWMNPFREEAPETPALLYGRALHCLVLEGVDEFKKRYRRLPTKDDAPDALVTAEDIRDVLRGMDAADRKARGIKLSGVNKDDLNGYIREHFPEHTLWDDLVAEFHATCARDRATALNEKDYTGIVQAAQYITAESRVRAAFENGVPELSAFWTMDGVPMKLRLDYTRLGKDGKKTIGIVTDLKSFANVMELPPERAVGNAITKTRLDVQMAAYMEGIQQIPKWISEGKVYGAEDVEPAWLDALGEVQDWRWFWLFYEKGLPVSLLRSVRVGSSLHDVGKMTLSRALQSYRDNMEAFGMDWRFVDPLPDPVIDVQDLPSWHARDE